MCYVQLARDEVITKTVVMYGGQTVVTGSELRYIGSGYSAQAVSWSYGTYISGLKVYFIC